MTLAVCAEISPPLIPQLNEVRTFRTSVECSEMQHGGIENPTLEGTRVAHRTASLLKPASANWTTAKQSNMAALGTPVWTQTNGSKLVAVGSCILSGANVPK
jgi:hypothetical protein